MIIETAYAKINFTLSVGSKRADGYHSIDSLMHSISLSDRITLTKAEAITLSVTEGEAPLGGRISWCAPRSVSSKRLVFPAASP